MRDSRSEVIKDMERALPYLEDTDMKELSHKVIGKLLKMRDKEFSALDLLWQENKQENREGVGIFIYADK